MKIIEQPPHIAYKHLLDKGEELTTGEVVYLLNKEVYAGKIAKATNLTIQEVRAIGERSDKYIENHKKVVIEMGKFNLTQAEYNDHKAQGKSDDDIAKMVGVSNGTLGYHKKKWSQEIKPRTPKPKLILAEGESSPTVHEDLVHDLSKKLRKSEAANEKQAEEIARLEVELGGVKKENQDKDIEITLLEQRIDSLKKEIQDLHAAAEDTEKEVAASQEYVEREQELMVDANVWKQKALQYEAEYKRQTDTLKEERAEKEKYKGESLAFRLALKAVL